MYPLQDSTKTETNINVEQKALVTDLERSMILSMMRNPEEWESDQEDEEHDQSNMCSTDESTSICEDDNNESDCFSQDENSENRDPNDLDLTDIFEEMNALAEDMEWLYSLEEDHGISSEEFLDSLISDLD